MKCDNCRKERQLQSISEATNLCSECIANIEKTIADRTKNEAKRKNQRDNKHIII